MKFDREGASDLRSFSFALICSRSPSTLDSFMKSFGRALGEMGAFHSQKDDFQVNPTTMIVDYKRDERRRTDATLWIHKRWILGSLCPSSLHMKDNGRR